MKYLLINAYSSKNRGDAGIVVAMIHLIKQLDKNADIDVMSSHWKENRTFYQQYGASSVQPIWELKQEESSLSRYINGIRSFLSVIVKKEMSTIQNYKEADVVISVGGGYLYSSRKGPLGVGLLNSLFHIWAAKKTKKKIIAFPQSVGPINSVVDQKLVKHILKNVDLFISRENITTEFLKRLNLKNVVEIADIGFTLPKKEVYYEKLNKSSSMKIGLTLLDWKFAKKGTTDENIEDYVYKVGEACNQIITKYPGCEFYIFPQVTVGEGDTDYEVSRKLFEYIKSKYVTIVDLDELSNNPEDLVYLYGEMDLFIGSRMHSTIFALAGGTPTVALAYQPKTRGTFKLIGLEQYVYDVDNFTTSELYHCLEEIVEMKNYPINQVSKEIDKIKLSLTSILKNELR
ncbi:hypothetical protein BTA37_25255 [Priestia megaterium]|uniref:polysaccharide pyruvyl transferase family protein n=1 Tax=Priestia megaterium TaxID=1404 RepID=UPI00094CACF7|nr:polysaccharide pyruvyl transferase family protein [Priestia megaterium]OLO27350.1 hypothetical protein BTA37_25255 [Priestia megaterium]